uniref:Lymphocyte cytosolic protein 2 n=1 Tax=Sphenodon punctatus TaxID=8508 RepID=A0A8D0L5T9_SPHPU
MDSKNIPYRSEVAGWSPDALADYLKRLNYKDCEKVVRKHSISGQRFLNMSENDIQKFPKLAVPILSKLSLAINRNEERRSIFPRRNPTQKFPENTEYRQDDDGGGWSSFDEEEEDDDYESPDSDQEAANEADYESPTGHDSEADYEPPPSNDDEALHKVIFPAKSITGNSEYIDRPQPATSPLQPPVPPQRPGSSPVPPEFGGRGNSLPPFREQRKPFKSPAPSIDRSTKPPLDLPGPFDRGTSGAGKRTTFPELAPQLRAQLAKTQKPPLPPGDRGERSNLPGRNPPPIRHGRVLDRKTEEEDDSMPPRPLPQPVLPPLNSSTFPRVGKPPPKPSTLGSHSMTPVSAESSGIFNSLHSGGSLPSQLGNINRNISRGAADGRPPLSIPNRRIHHPQPTSTDDYEDSLNQEWYVASITRPEAEASLKKINQDGTFLVRDSSKKTLTNPYVLMVLYRDKVYNIQIRYQEQNCVYLLGTGLRGKEDFNSVADIIDYFRRTPLLLIDGKDRGSRNQCTLTYAAGFV